MWWRALGALAFLLLAPSPARPADEAPLEIALAVDTSGSLKTARAQRDAIVRRLVEALPPGTRVSLHAFDTEPRLVLPAGRSRDEVVRAAARLPASGRYTALNDAIYDATRAVADGLGPRAVVVVTDGTDENSALETADGVAAAREADVPVFLVGVGRVADRPLRRIAKLTGGAYLSPQTRAATAAERIAAGARKARRAPAPVVAPDGPPPPTTAAATPSPAVAAVPARPSRAWTWALLAALAMAGLVLGVAAMMLRPGAPPEARKAAPPVPPPAVAGTLATRLEDIPPVERTMVLTMRPLLHALRGGEAGKLFEVSRQRATLIGRAPGNDIVLEDLAVSAQHCRVRPAEQGGFEVLDVGSTNGTFVNEKRVTRERLSPGDSLKVGETVLQFRLDHTGDA